MHADETLGPVGDGARRVIEIDDVLDASIASGLQDRAQPHEDLALDLLVLGRRLDDDIAVGEGLVGDAPA